MGLTTTVLIALGSAIAAPAATHAADAVIRRLNAEEVNAFLGQDRPALAQLWADEFVVTNPLNRFATRAEVLQMIDSGFLVITAYARRIEYLRQYGDTAIVAGSETVTWGGRMPLAGQTQRLRFTAVWRFEKGRWREVARHANVVPAEKDSD